MKAYLIDTEKLIPPYHLAITDYQGKYQPQKTIHSEPKGTWGSYVSTECQELPSFLKITGSLQEEGKEVVILNANLDVVGIAYSDVAVTGLVEIYLEVDTSITYATEYIDDRNQKLIPSVSVEEQGRESKDQNVYVLESDTYQLPSPMVYIGPEGDVNISKYLHNYLGEYTYEIQDGSLCLQTSLGVGTRSIKGDMLAVAGRTILDIRDVTEFNDLTYLIPFTQKDVPATGKIKLYTRRPTTNKIRKELYPATYTDLGGISVGNYLQVTKDGELSLNLQSIEGVFSVNEEVGHVTLFPHPVLSVNSKEPDDEGNVELDSYTLPVASSTELGGVKPNDQFTITETGILNYDAPVKSVNSKTGHVKESFVVTVNNVAPSTRGNVELGNIQVNIATTSKLGIIVVVGQGLIVDEQGLLSVDDTGLVTSVDGRTGPVEIDPYELPKATTALLGGVTIGDYVYVDEQGKLQYDLEAIKRYYPVISVNGEQGHVEIPEYSLAPATKEELGGIRVGSNLIISEEGVLNLGNIVFPDYAVRSVNGELGDVTLPTYVLPPATTEDLGGVVLGGGIKSLPDGTIYVDKAWLSPPVATRDILGIVMVGSTFTHTPQGVLSVNPLTIPMLEGTGKKGFPMLGASVAYNRVIWSEANWADHETQGYVRMPPNREITLTYNNPIPNGYLHTLNASAFRSAVKESPTAKIGYARPGRYLDVVDGYLVNIFPEVRVWSVNGREGHVEIDGYVDKYPGTAPIYIPSPYAATSNSYFVDSSKMANYPPLVDGLIDGASTTGSQYQQRLPNGGTIQVYTSTRGELYRYIPAGADWTAEPFVTDSPWSVQLDRTSPRGTQGTFIYDPDALTMTRSDANVLERKLYLGNTYETGYAGVKVISVYGSSEGTSTQAIVSDRPRRIYVKFNNPSIEQTLIITANSYLPRDYVPEIVIVGKGTVRFNSSSTSQVIDPYFNLLYYYYYYLEEEAGATQVTGDGTTIRLYGTYNTYTSSSTGQIRRRNYYYNIARIQHQGNLI